ncbi:acyl-CoA-like ligand-binding transcription factor [Streptomyces sp. SP18CS02]|uniref:acyl-CoA-like ligand-binding transcription factor n=1 Tax=Streptomyces sp. SP18CS02 TaxID=3002531 RepID=UPI002E75B1DD|nr:TetR family transcriptional regulator [Streptomyces sp. SP18CS02]MEE1756264.1 TetR family transcriptional regulator [Streptomyces sp. SP18CS02]
MAADPLLAGQPRMGLRERKKRKTRLAIRRAAHRLIAEQGYQATTVEQIAEAAEVSPSTVCRYFPAKEDIVLTGEHELVVESVLRSRPADEEPLESLRHLLVESVRAVLADDPEEMRQRTRLMVEVPAVRARMTETMAETSGLLSRALAARSGRAADDLEVRIVTAAVMGALREVTIHWAEHGQRDDLVALVDRTLDVLKGGLALRPAPAGGRAGAVGP